MSYYYIIEGFKSNSEFLELEDILHEKNYFPGKSLSSNKELLVPTKRGNELNTIVQNFGKHLRLKQIKEYKPLITA